MKTNEGILLKNILKFDCNPPREAILNAMEEYKNLPPTKTGIELIAQERDEQINKHGYDANFISSHPLFYSEGQLLFAAQILISNSRIMQEASCPKNWDVHDIRRMANKNKIERLKIAGALIAAEIDRLKST